MRPFLRGLFGWYAECWAEFKEAFDFAEEDWIALGRFVAGMLVLVLPVAACFVLLSLM